MPVSADFNDPSFAALLAAAPAATLAPYRAENVRDLVIHFKGFNADQGALVNNKPQFQALLDTVFNTPTYAAWHKRPLMQTWNGAFDTDRGVDDAVRFITNFFDPRGRLVVLGES